MMKIQSDDTFYPDLPYFEDFGAISDESIFRPVPHDWHVIISDIRNSTQAVEAGRYKHVNMIGAACITAALNAVRSAAGESTEIPYSFGGDGATLLVPDILLSPVRKALLAAASMAQREFGFELRIGSISVKAIREKGVDVTVSKLRLSPGNELAMFGGGGIALADALIKQDDLGHMGYRFIASGDEGEPDMTGLSCRWEPLKSRQGQMLCVLAYAKSTDVGERRKTYDRLLRNMSRILGGDLKSASPVTEQTMRFKWIPQGLRMEAQITHGEHSYGRRLL
ncbi:MAG: DUF3095 family protein, partial [Alphaproteobacteria bacterium]|nr:DUF3095 family protein [Alphaproteobacteria bacterium]